MQQERANAAAGCIISPVASVKERKAAMADLPSADPHG